MFKFPTLAEFWKGGHVLKKIDECLNQLSSWFSLILSPVWLSPFLHLPNFERWRKFFLPNWLSPPSCHSPYVLLSLSSPQGQSSSQPLSRPHSSIALIHHHHAERRDMKEDETRRRRNRDAQEGGEKWHQTQKRKVWGKSRRKEHSRGSQRQRKRQFGKSKVEIRRTLRRI